MGSIGTQEEGGGVVGGGLDPLKLSKVSGHGCMGGEATLWGRGGLDRAQAGGKGGGNGPWWRQSGLVYDCFVAQVCRPHV